MCGRNSSPDVSCPAPRAFPQTPQRDFAESLNSASRPGSARRRFQNHTATAGNFRRKIVALRRSARGGPRDRGSRREGFRVGCVDKGARRRRPEGGRPSLGDSPGPPHPRDGRARVPPPAAIRSRDRRRTGHRADGRPRPGERGEARRLGVAFSLTMPISFPQWSRWWRTSRRLGFRRERDGRPKVKRPRRNGPGPTDAGFVRGASAGRRGQRRRPRVPARIASPAQCSRPYSLILL